MSTVVVAGAAVVSIVLTMFLLGEQRANRVVAQVQAYPRTYAGHTLTLRLENFGPAPALDVDLTYRVVAPDGSVGARNGTARPS